MRAALYARISEDRDGTALGVARQLEDCRTYATRRGWTVVGEYVDNDVSATSGRRRPEYERLTADIQRGLIQAVVVWALDRLHRRPAELEQFIDLADRYSISLGSIGGDVDLATPAGRLHARIMGGVARHEVEQKSARIRRAALQRAQQGGNHGGRRAFGYTPNGLELIPDEAAEVRHAYEQLMAGVPLAALTRDLNARGVRTVTGRPWTPSTVRDMLGRPRNAGLSEYHGEIVGTGQWPAVVSEEVWRAAAALLADPARRTSTGNKASYLLSGIATCGLCGETAPITSAGTKRETGGVVSWRRIYKCRRCSRVSRRQDWCDEYIGQVVVARLARPDAADLLVDRDRPDVHALGQEAQALRIRLDEAASAFADGAITSMQLRTASDRIRARLVEIDAAMAHTSRAPVLVELVKADNVQAAWDGLPLDRQRAVVRTLMAVVLHPGGGGRRVFDPSKVEIIWRV
ncbi:MAG TPA: recombinase family protein [Nocardioidaceae bacterium]